MIFLSPHLFLPLDSKYSKVQSMSLSQPGILCASPLLCLLVSNVYQDESVTQKGAT